MNFLKTKPQIRNIKYKFYDLFSTVIENRDDKEIVNNKHEENENDYNNFDDFITRNFYIGMKNDIILLR